MSTRPRLDSTQCSCSYLTILSSATAFSSLGVDKWGRRITLITGCALIVSMQSPNPKWPTTYIEQVISYIIIGALADAFPVTTNFNRGAAIVQVIFIYVIEMVRRCRGVGGFGYMTTLIPIVGVTFQTNQQINSPTPVVLAHAPGFTPQRSSQPISATRASISLSLGSKLRLSGSTRRGQ